MSAVHTAAAIEVQAVSKWYVGAAGPYQVLDEVSLSIVAGEFVSLIGPSGGGKSTLLNLLAGLEAADAGLVRIDGKGLGTRPPIAYMQQKDLLLPWRTLWDNLLLGPELGGRKERARLTGMARELVLAFGLAGFEQAYPAQLSGGMRQRAALIRTLLCEQPILLLDEPFGALDAITRRRLQQLLLRVWQDYGQTVLLVTHDVDEAVLLSQRVMVFSAMPGRVLSAYDVPIPYAQRVRMHEVPEALRLRSHLLAALEGPDAAA